MVSFRTRVIGSKTYAYPLVKTSAQLMSGERYKVPLIARKRRHVTSMRTQMKFLVFTGRQNYSVNNFMDLRSEMSQKKDNSQISRVFKRSPQGYKQVSADELMS